jgi:hypothetical protein
MARSQTQGDAEVRWCLRQLVRVQVDLKGPRAPLGARVGGAAGRLGAPMAAAWWPPAVELLMQEDALIAARPLAQRLRRRLGQEPAVVDDWSHVR